MAASKEIGVLLPLIVAALISVSGCIQAEPYAVYPHIEPAEGPSLDHITYEYRYMEGQVSLTIPVDASVYWGAKNADKQAHIHGEMEDEEWLPGYYRSFKNGTKPWPQNSGSSPCGLSGPNWIEFGRYLIESKSTQEQRILNAEWRCAVPHYTQKGANV